MERRTLLKGRAFLGALRGRCVWAVRLDGTLWMTTNNHDGRPSVPHGSDDRIIRLRVT